MRGGELLGLDVVKMISVVSMLIGECENSWRTLELSGSAIKFLPMLIVPISGDSDFVAISIGLVNRPPKIIVLSWILTFIQGSGLRVSDENMKLWSVI